MVGYRVTFTFLHTYNRTYTHTHAHTHTYTQRRKSLDTRCITCRNRSQVTFAQLCTRVKTQLAIKTIKVNMLISVSAMFWVHPIQVTFFYLQVSDVDETNGLVQATLGLCSTRYENQSTLTLLTQEAIAGERARGNSPHSVLIV